MRICIKEITKKSFCNIWHDKLEWIRLASAPVLIWGLGFLFIQAIAWVMATEIAIFENVALLVGNPIVLWNLGPMAVVGAVVYFIANVLAINTFYINGLRYSVYGDYGQHWLTFQWNKRVLRLIVYSFCITAVTMAFMAVAAGAVMALGLEWYVMTGAGLLFLVGLYIKLRISLYYLLIAADYERPLRTSWALLKKHILQLLGLLIVVGLGIAFITIVVLALFHGILYLIGAGPQEELRSIVTGIVWFFALTVYMQVFAHVFQAVKEKEKKNKKA